MRSESERMWLEVENFQSFRKYMKFLSSAGLSELIKFLTKRLIKINPKRKRCEQKNQKDWSDSKTINTKNLGFWYPKTVKIIWPTFFRASHNTSVGNGEKRMSIYRQKVWMNYSGPNGRLILLWIKNNWEVIKWKTFVTTKQLLPTVSVCLSFRCY